MILRIIFLFLMSREICTRVFFRLQTLSNLLLYYTTISVNKINN